jgi:hypothetical protein
MKVETDIIANITASLMGQTAILPKMYVYTFKTMLLFSSVMS